MNYLISFIFFAGLIIAAMMAKQNSPTWPAKLMFIVSIISFISYSLVAIVLSGMNWSMMWFIGIISLINLVCIILYFIGLLVYCLKTYAATKANEQLEFLNFQLNDQVEIRLSNQGKANSSTNITQP